MSNADGQPGAGSDTAPDSKGTKAPDGDDGGDHHTEMKASDYLDLLGGKEDNPGPGAAGDKSQTTRDADDKSKSGSETDAKPKEKLLAGKYRDVTELEKGYTELHSASNQALEQNKQLAEQVKKLNADLEALKAGSGDSKGGKPENAGNAGEQPPAWKPLADKVRETLGDDLADQFAGIFASYDARLQKAADPSPEEVARREAEENERQQAAFLAKYPDAKGEMFDAMVALSSEIATKGNDPQTALELIYYAQRGKTIEKVLESERAKIRKEVEAELRAGGLATSLSHAGRGRSSGEGDDKKPIVASEYLGMK